MLHSQILKINHLVDALDAAKNSPKQIFWHGNKQTIVQTWGQIQQQAHAMACQLQCTRLQGRVGLVAYSNPQFLIAFFACQYAGLTPVLLPIPRLGQKNWFDWITQLMLSAKCQILLGETDQGNQQDLIECIPWSNLPTLDLTKPRQLTPSNTHDAYIQFSSGSSGLPKGIVISQAALCANVQDILIHGLAIREDDKALSWLPFFHDMGFVGFVLAPLFALCEIHYMPSRYVSHERIGWLAMISELGITISYAPTFSYRRLLQSPLILDGLDLSRWRIAGVGAERIDYTVLKSFAHRYREHGFRLDAFWPSYGMAESTLAISMRHQDDALISDKTTGDMVMSCGRVLPNIDLKIIPCNNHDNQQVMGKILVKGNAIATHHATHQTLLNDDGWLDTGDLGYLAAGQLFITGREKECFQLNGRNFWPDRIEEQLQGILPKKIGIALLVIEINHQTDMHLILAKRPWVLNEQEHLERKCLQYLFGEYGVSAQVHFIEDRISLKTSSGKTARLHLAKLIQNGALNELKVKQ